MVKVYFALQMDILSLDLGIYTYFEVYTMFDRKLCQIEPENLSHGFRLRESRSRTLIALHKDFAYAIFKKSAEIRHRKSRTQNLYAERLAYANAIRAA
jgi:hypothetical protein